MAEKKQNAQPEKNPDQVEKEKLESVKRADAAVKSMNDFTSPEVLYDELISSVKKYHPSTDISMIEKAYEVAKTYILVAHNGISRVIQSYFYEMTNEEYATFGVKNCEVRRFDFE